MRQLRAYALSSVYNTDGSEQRYGSVMHDRTRGQSFSARAHSPYTLGPNVRTCAMTTWAAQQNGRCPALGQTAQQLVPIGLLSITMP
jgi:hypothetical protein